MLKGADHLRVSLLPSLLESRRINESIGNAVIEQYEAAHVYLPVDGQLPREQVNIGIVTGGDFYFGKGVLEALLRALHIEETLEFSPVESPWLDPAASSRLQLGGQLLGLVGQLSGGGIEHFGLRNPATVAEINFDLLCQFARLVPRYAPQSSLPAIWRDVNLVMDESVRWSGLAATVRQAAGSILESLEYRETYRDPQKDGPAKKRILFTFSVRSPERTLTSDEADRVRDAIVSACAQQHGAKLL
jgi:phenylalanyl-tRNA synthetase beta chain